MQKTKKAFHQLKTIHQLLKAFNFPQAMGVLLKVYQNAEERQKITTRQMTRFTYY